MTSFYVGWYATGDKYLWDPILMRATSNYSTQADTWLDYNADMDQGDSSNVMGTYSTSDADRITLLSKLNYEETKTFDDIQSKASTITGDGNMSGVSSLWFTTSEGCNMGKKLALKLQLVKANSELVDHDHALQQMQEQINQLLALQNLAVKATVPL